MAAHAAEPPATPGPPTGGDQQPALEAASSAEAPATQDAAADDGAGVETRLRATRSQAWYSARTPHFEVHVHRSALPVGERVVALAEGVHDEVTAVWGWTPRRRTTIVVDDGTDGANGSATVTPWPTIRINAAPPGFDEALGHFDDWLRLLLVHEYTHVVHIGRVGGLPRAANFLVGLGVYPNGGVPRWWIEGLAVVAESASTARGRLHSPLFTSWIRASALDGDLARLGQLSGAPLDWPQATAWYLYGAWYVQHLADEAGWDAIRRMVDRTGRQVVPLPLNRMARQELEIGIVSEWPAFLAGVSGESAAVRVAAMAAGAAPHRRESAAANRSRFVTVDMAGEPVWWEIGTRDEPRLVGGGRELTARDVGELDFVGPDEAIVVLTSRLAGGLYYGDLYRWNLTSGERQPLTRGARAGEPAVSPDRLRVAHTRIHDGGADLWTLNLVTGHATQLTRGGQVADPVWLDEETVAFAWHQEGQRAVWTVDVATGAATPWFSTGGSPLDLHAWPGGLVFSSDHDHELDVYMVRRGGDALCRLTRAVTGAVSPVVVGGAAGGAPRLDVTDGDGEATPTAKRSARVYFGTLTGDGYAIVSVPLRVDACVPLPAWRPGEEAESPAPDGGLSENEDGLDGGEARPAAPLAGAAARWRRRTPIDALHRPRIVPSVALTTLTQVFGATATTSDPPERLSLAATAQWDRSVDTVLGSASVTVQVLPLGLSLGAARGYLRRDAWWFAQSRYVPFIEEQRSLVVTAWWSFPRLGEASSMYASWATNHGSVLEGPGPLPPDPTDIPPRTPSFGRFDSLRLGWSWHDTQRQLDDVSTSAGSWFDVSVGMRSPVIGADAESGDLVVAGGHYVQPGGGRAVLALRGAGGVAQANGVSRRQFVLGGVAPHDPLAALFALAPAGNGDVRGYPPGLRQGDRFVRLNSELRFPLLAVDRGAGTFPLYAGRLRGVVFADAGWASVERFRLRDALASAGAELRLSTMLGYRVDADFRVGVGRGLTRDGIWDAYLLYGFEY